MTPVNLIYCLFFQKASFLNAAYLSSWTWDVEKQLYRGEAKTEILVLDKMTCDLIFLKSNIIFVSWHVSEQQKSVNIEQSQEFWWE